MWISEQAAAFVLYIINWLVFITVVGSVYCADWFLIYSRLHLVFKRLITCFTRQFLRRMWAIQFDFLRFFFFWQRQNNFLLSLLCVRFLNYYFLCVWAARDWITCASLTVQQAETAKRLVFFYKSNLPDICRDTSMCKKSRQAGGEDANNESSSHNRLSL